MKLRWGKKVLAFLFCAGLCMTAKPAWSQEEDSSQAGSTPLFQLYKEGKFEEALSLSEEKLLKDPYDTETRYFRAKIFIALKDWDDAIRECKEILGYEDRFGAVDVVLGQAFLGKEDYETALQCFDRAVKEKAEFPEVYRDLAVIYAYGKDYEGAIRQAKQAIEKNPGFIDAYYAVGRFYAETERYEDAIPYFDKTLMLDPDHEKAKEMLAFSFLKTGESGKARQIAQELLEDNPSSEVAKTILEKEGKEIRN